MKATTSIRDVTTFRVKAIGKKIRVAAPNSLQVRNPFPLKNLRSFETFGIVIPKMLPPLDEFRDAVLALRIHPYEIHLCPGQQRRASRAAESDDDTSGCQHTDSPLRDARPHPKQKNRRVGDRDVLEYRNFITK